MKLLLALLVALSASAASAQTSSGPAPVQSVNTAIGNVVVPTVCRQAAPSPLSVPQSNPASVAWSFPNSSCVFATTPTCYPTLASSSSGFAFDAPLQTAISVSGVTFSITAHPSSLTIASVLNLPLALPVTTAAPAGTTLTITCVGPPQ